MGDGIKELSLRGLADMVKRNGDDRFCFILGAGASKASGIATGGEMARDWLGELRKGEADTRKWIEDNGITDENAGEFYPAIYERRFYANYEEGYRFLQKAMNKDKVKHSIGYYYLARVLAETSNRFVITTNFDSLTEDAVFMYTDKKPLVITHEQLARYVSALDTRPVIVKVHRDLLLNPWSTKKDTGKMMGKLKAAVRRVFDNFKPIVIGYGGNDGSLMDVLNEVFTRDGGRPLYWCHAGQGEPNKKVMDLLERSGGYLVRIDNFDGAMYLIGNAYGYSFMEKEERQKAEERVGALKKADNEFREAANKENDRLSVAGEAIKEAMSEDAKKKLAELDRRIEETKGHKHKNTDAYYSRAYFYYEMGRYEEALNDYAEAISSAPHYAPLYLSAADACVKLRDTAKVYAFFDKIKVTDVGRPYFLSARGYFNLYMARRKHRFCDHGVLADLSEGIELVDEPWPQQYCWRGQYYVYVEDWQKALDDLTKATDIDPRYGEAWHYLACCHEASGDDAEFHHCINMAVELEYIPDESEYIPDEY